MSDIYLQHVMTIIVSVFLRGYRGKTVDFSIVSQHHRTTVAYFLNHGKARNELAHMNLLSNEELCVILKAGKHKTASD